MHDLCDTDREKLRENVIKFLSFSSQYTDIASEIANFIVDTAGLQRVVPERARRLDAHQRMVMAVRTYIRHTYTAYDDVLIENSIEQTDLSMGDDYGVQHDDAVDAVTEFIERHRR